MPAFAGKSSHAILVASCTLALVCTTVAGAAVSVSGELFFGIWSPTRNQWEATTPVCVTDREGGAYRVRVSGLAGGEEFALLDPGGYSVDYRLSWLRSGTRGEREQLTAGVASQRVYQSSTEANCIDAEPPHLQARINDRTLDLAPPGVYRDTLFIIIEPI